VIVMKLRLGLTFVSVFLSLSISADRSFTNCPQAWFPNANSETLEQGLGVNIHFTDPQPGEMKMIADAGFRWVRMDFKWDATERERGHYDFSAYDRLMQSLDQFKLRALFILDYGNPLYGTPPRTENARQAFARWVVAAAKHFAGHGVTWEMYNEPNVPMFWPPRPNVDEYVALALTVGRAFRANVPNEKLIGPATSGIDFNFLEACFKAGLLDYWSAVSAHPYRRTNPERAANEYCRLRQLIDRYRARVSPRSDSDGPSVSTASVSDRVIPIISGEWGFSSAWPRIDEAKQSALLARELLTNIANDIPMSIWYDWREDGTDPRDPEHHFGLVRNAYLSDHAQVYQPKPAYLATKTLTDFFRGYRFQERLAVGRNEDYVLVFANGTDRRIAAWTTSTDVHRIAIPLGPGTFLMTRHTGEAATSISANQQGLTIEVSSAPVYVMRSAHPQP
jgi:hypothetical protein